MKLLSAEHIHCVITSMSMVSQVSVFPESAEKIVPIIRIIKREIDEGNLDVTLSEQAKKYLEP